MNTTFDRFGDFDVVLVAFGVLGDQERAERHGAEALDIVQTNFTGVVSVTRPARAAHEGSRGTARSCCSRASRANGRAARTSCTARRRPAPTRSSKGSPSSLVGTGVHVLIVRPGFVTTKMTAGMKAAPLSTTPEAVGEAIVHALERDREVVWVPPALRFVMSGLRHLPRPVFRKLPL